MLPQLYEYPSIRKQRSKDAVCAPQMALRISLELLFLGRIRPSKCTLVIDRPEDGRLCDAGAPDDGQYGVPERLIVFVRYEPDCGTERYGDGVRREGTRTTADRAATRCGMWRCDRTSERPPRETPSKGVA